ncbi:MAG TPA: CDP-diacylglycerol--serine O-phosphatidyltransferase [Bacteroidota bacterium]|nr:CDP-diacylglycerol--serine O-phosphatidyltransferase [Bacteroidota bacterium]
MKITRAVVPSLFTVLNIFSGFRSIIHTAQGDYVLASWFIILAAIFDVLDGIMARITKSSSGFGVEFDSLSDVVSFGAAPSFLVYSVFLHTMEGIGMLVSAMPLILGALRLARFNTQLVGYDKEYFRGLPIPATAVTIGAFVLQNLQEGNTLTGLPAALLAPMVVVLSILMVSTIKYDTVPKFSRRGIKQHPLRFTVGIIGITAIAVTAGQALFPFFLFYIATGPMRTIVQVIRYALHPELKQLDEKEAEISSIDI